MEMNTYYVNITLNKNNAFIILIERYFVALIKKKNSIIYIQYKRIIIQVQQYNIFINIMFIFI